MSALLALLSALGPAVPPAAGGATLLTCDVPAAGAIDSAIDVDLFEFSAVSGEFVRITAVETPPYIGDLNPVFRLLTATGQPAVGTGAGCHSGLTVSGDCGPLAASDSPYRIEVSALIPGDTGDYLVHLQRLGATTACDQVPLVCGTPEDGFLDPAETDLFSFLVTDGAVVRVGLLETPPQQPFVPIFRLLTSSGQPAVGTGAGCHSGLSVTGDCGPLAASDNPYRLEVLDSGFFDQAGGYQLSVQPLAGQCIPALIFSDGFESGDSSAWSLVTRRH